MNILKAAILHIEESPKCQNGPLNVTLEEKALLEFVKNNPKATQDQIAEYIGKSSRTVKRENGKRNGFWIIIL